MRDMKRQRQQASSNDDIFAADVLLSSGRRELRIEPRIGNDFLDEAIPTSKFGRNEQHIEPAKTDKKKPAVAEVRVLRDVLLEGPRTGSVAENIPSQRPDALVRRVRGYTKTLPQGNKARSKKINKGSARDYVGFFRKLSLCLMGLILVFGLYWVGGPVKKAFERPIKSVVVEGEFNFITKQHATDLIGNEIDGDFLQLDLMRIKKVLLEDPWVDEITLTRRWPDTLVVKITEQKPIARWGKGFLNQRGEIVQIDGKINLSDLPYMQGSESDAAEILQQYQDLSQLLRSRGLEVIALSCDSKKAWRLTLKNDIEIIIGRDQVMEKMQRFIAVYDVQLSHVWSQVKAIDVRYSNGVAVRWVANSVMAKKFLKS